MRSPVPGRDDVGGSPRVHARQTKQESREKPINIEMKISETKHRPGVVDGFFLRFYATGWSTTALSTAARRDGHL